MAAIKCIGIITSGDDAPGMNSAIRSVTRSAIYNGLRVKAIYRGYKGLIDGEIVEFQTQNVSNIIQQGGTILKSSESKDFMTQEGRKKAYENMMKEEIDALVVIGGDGSLSGARIFAQEYDVPCIGIPATIDNNLCGTDTTIGYDTALNTIMQSVDKIRDTATSHERLFFVEVVGDDAGFLALNGAIASGCEAAIIPSIEIEEHMLTQFIQNGFKKKKKQQYRARRRKQADWWSHALRRHGQDTISGTRCKNINPWTSAARRTPYSTRQNHSQPNGCGQHTGNNERIEKRHGGYRQ